MCAGALQYPLCYLSHVVQVYQRLEKGNNADYWQDITVIVEDELHKLRKLDSRTGSQYEAAVERREGINKAVLTDVQHIFRGQLLYPPPPSRHPVLLHDIYFRLIKF